VKPSDFERVSNCVWRIEPHGEMRVPGIVYADEALLGGMDHKVWEQLCNVAALPGIVSAAYAMPDAHWGYGFPIGGVAAFDPAAGGVVSAGGVGFDISCGVRTLLTGLTIADIRPVQSELADALFHDVPSGIGATGTIRLDPSAMDAMLGGGARWAVDVSYGDACDLARIEEGGCIAGADPAAVSKHAKRRQRDELGTLGSGNHYLEIQHIAEVYDEGVAAAFGLVPDEIVATIHCGSRGLGHQIGTEYLRDMAVAAPRFGIRLPDRELACAPLESELGQRYLGAMRAAVNCALANRQIITHLVRQTFARVLPRARLELLYDVSHNTCKLEEHSVGGETKALFIHRKGATRAFGPGHPALPDSLRPYGQPVLIGGSMGTASYVLVGTADSERLAFGSACHGAGRAMSRHAAARTWRGDDVTSALASSGVLIRSASRRGVAEEAPGAYKDVGAVVGVAHELGLARKVALLKPLVCVKG